MNKDYQLNQLRLVLADPSLKSGLYLVDTDLGDDEIENFIKGCGLCTYIHEPIIPTSEGSVFELLVVGLSYRCTNEKIDFLRDRLMSAEGRAKENVLLSLLIQILQDLCNGYRSVIHIIGHQDLLLLDEESLYKLYAALSHNDSTILIFSKKKSTQELPTNSFIKYISLKEKIKFWLMENKLEKVHISYKHDNAYAYVMEIVKNSLKHNNIQYTIDEDGIKYRDSIVEYEKEIGAADRVIMVVIPKYLESIDCMFEMAEMFKKGNIRERIFPLVDLGGEIPRNAEGLEKIKKFWDQKKTKTLERIGNDNGNSIYYADELKKIMGILVALDEFWDYIVHYNTGDFKSLVANDAKLLIEALQKTLPSVTAPVNDKFVPTDATKPADFRIVTQNGEKSIYIEHNVASITIS